MNRTAAWRTVGSILIAAAGIIIAFAYLTRPSAASCAYSNQVSPGSCGANPSTGVFIVAGVLALAGILILVNVRKPG